MKKNLKFAVILAGCGNKDGAEIQEAVLTLLAIDKHGGSYACFAPDIKKARVLNFLNNEVMAEERSVLLESARIARSDIKALSEFKAQEFDVLILPGGSGVAHNLCTFAKDGFNMTINADVVTAVESMRQLNKPIGALCIAPVILAKLIPGAELTFGQDTKMSSIFNNNQVVVKQADVDGIVVDRKHKLVSTPCYMISNARIGQIAIGIEKCVLALMELL